jgi:hypothetical protein
MKRGGRAGRTESPEAMDDMKHAVKHEKGGYCIWIGWNPEDQLMLRISKEDREAIPPRNSSATRTITDLDSGAKYLVRSAFCGLEGCNCALGIVEN